MPNEKVRVYVYIVTVESLDSIEPDVGVVSTMKLNSPVRMVDTDHAGFQLRTNANHQSQLTLTLSLLLKHIYALRVRMKVADTQAKSVTTTTTTTTTR